MYKKLFMKNAIPCVLWEKKQNNIVCIDINEKAMDLFANPNEVTNQFIGKCLNDIRIIAGQNTIERTLNKLLDDHKRTLVEIVDEKSIEQNANIIVDCLYIENNIAATMFKELCEVLDELEHYSLQVKQQYNFLSHMSHEIRTPLNAIIGSISLLEDTELKQEQLHYVNVLKQSSVSLVSIVNDVLDVSKLESGKLSLNKDRMDLHQCIESSVDIVSPAASKKKLELVLFIDEDVPSYIICDFQRLRQILVNILSNGIKFTHKGSVKLTVTCVENNEETDEIMFKVEDSGIGIAQEDQKKLFRPFIQVDQSMNKEYEGTGLGLIISKHLCKLMGGNIWFDSTQKVGSTFCFTIKVEKSDVPKSRTFGTGVNLDILKGKSAIIVDDKEFNRQYIQTILGKYGMISFVFASSAEVINFFKYYTNPIDIGLIDICMPSMDGKMLAVEIQNLAKSFPLIALSSFGDKIADKNLFFEHVPKPIHESTLIRVVYRALTTKIPLSSSGIYSNTASNKDIKILVAEDIYLNQVVLEDMLQKLGYKNIKTVNDGAEAIDALKDRKYDVILLDIKMPKKDGLKVAKEIQELYGTDRPYIIALTAVLFENKTQLLSKGFDRYLVKPINICDLHTEMELYHKN